MLARSSANLSGNSKEFDAYARLIWQAQIIHKANCLNINDEEMAQLRTMLKKILSEMGDVA